LYYISWQTKKNHSVKKKNMFFSEDKLWVELGVLLESQFLMLCYSAFMFWYFVFGIFYFWAKHPEIRYWPFGWWPFAVFTAWVLIFFIHVFYCRIWNPYVYLGKIIYWKYLSGFYKTQDTFYYTRLWVYVPLTFLLVLSLFSGYLYQDIFLGQGSDFFFKDVYVNPIQKQRFFEAFFDTSFFFQKYFPFIITFLCFVSVEYFIYIV
jgi:hypothetical protein